MAQETMTIRFTYDNTKIHPEYLTAAVNGFADHVSGGTMSAEINVERPAIDLKTLMDKIQEYLDDSDAESDNFMVGQNVTFAAATDLLNDLLLYLNEGSEGFTVDNPYVTREGH